MASILNDLNIDLTIIYLYILLDMKLLIFTRQILVTILLYSQFHMLVIRTCASVSASDINHHAFITECMVVNQQCKSL